MLVTVSPSDLGTVVFHGSIVLVTGTSEDWTERVTFAGDTRMMATFLDAIEGSDEQQCAEVQSWQIQRVESALQPCGCPTQFVADCGHQEGCKEA